MKKLITLLSLLTFTIVSWAGETLTIATQPTALEDLSAAKTYVVFVKECKAPNAGDGQAATDLGYLYYHSGRVRVANFSDAYVDGTDYLWQITRAENGNIKFHHLKTNSGINQFDLKTAETAESGFGLTANSMGQEYTATGSAADGYKFQGAGGKAWLNVTTVDGKSTDAVNHNTTALWVAYDEARAGLFQFFEVTATHDTDALSSAEIEDGYYYIRLRKSYTLFDVRNPYLAENGNAMKLQPGSELNNGCIWKISHSTASNLDEANNGKAYFVQNYQSGSYFTDGPSAPLGSNARSYSIIWNAENDGYLFRGHANESAISNKGYVTPLSATGFGRKDAALDESYYEIVRVSALPVTVIYKDAEGHVLKNTVLLAEENAEVLTVAAAGAPDFCTLESAETERVVFTQTEYNVTCQVNLPMAFDKFYRMFLRKKEQSNNYIKYNADNARMATRNNTDADVIALDRMWFFKPVSGNPLKVTLHCLAAYDGRKGVSLSGSNVTISDTPTQFIVVRNTTAGGSGFSLQQPDNANAHLNDVNGTLGIWNYVASKNDGGSLFTIEAHDFTADEINSLYASYAAGDLQSDQLGAGYALSQERREAVAADPTFDNVLSLYVPAFSEVVDAGKYYRVTFARPWQGKGTMTLTGYANPTGSIDDYAGGAGSNEETRNVQMLEENAANVSQLWKFVPAEGGGYLMQNANSSTHYVGTPAQYDTHVTGYAQYAAKFVPFAQALDGRWVMNYNATNCLNARNDNNNICNYYGGFSDGGNIVTITRVESVPVTVGPTGYATLCLPFAATIPAEVTAYTAESTGTASDGTQYVVLKEISGTIPASCGVILTATAGTYSFEISGATPAGVEGNLLTGVTLTRHGFGEGSHYGLKAVDGEAVLAKNGQAVNVPSNKAILETANVASAAKLLRFDFGGETTGIGHVATETGGDVKFYDLNGRRVERPAHGIYVTADGRKVWIK